MKHLLEYYYVLVCLIGLSDCLFPFETTSRSKFSLNGLWEFKVDYKNEGFTNQWYTKIFSKEFSDTLPMSVPSSFNELYTDRSIKDHIGWTWYNRQFYVSDAVLSDLSRYSVILRFASCHYFCVAWINGVKLGQHESGHLPFEFDITNNLVRGLPLNLVVALNNTLTPFTIPAATLFYGNDSNLWPDGFVQQTLQMDFYNFAGIHRDVVIYVKPRYSIQDITIKTDYDSASAIGTINYEVTHNCMNKPSFVVTIRDNKSRPVLTNNQPEASLSLNDAIPWWPKFMNGDQPLAYLYKFDVNMTCDDTSESYTDTYSLDFGIRTVSWSGDLHTKPSWKINSKDFYCLGANRHEDFPIIGRGVNLAIAVKDIYLLQMLNANCMRTSHYPYAEEFMQLTDRLGIAVIDETPAVGLSLPINFNNITLALHKNLLHELYNRDKNHASVVAWSVGNEPYTEFKESVPYFKEIFRTINEIDSSRPKTFTTFKTYDKDLCANMSDIIFLNRYYSVYIEPGRLDIIAPQLTTELQNWYYKHGKPMVYPEQMFCEEYQSSLIKEYAKVFDSLRQKRILFGELIWNLIDTKTGVDLRRPYGNHKGLFTFERQPKQAAFVLQERYEQFKNGL